MKQSGNRASKIKKKMHYNKEGGVKVVLKDGREGFIVRRLDAHSYQIWIEETDEQVVLSPEEFREKEKEK